MADLRHGVATAVLANVNRDSNTRPEPYTAQDFVYWQGDRQEAEEVVLIEDPVEHSNFMRAALFGKMPD